MILYFIDKFVSLSEYRISQMIHNGVDCISNPILSIRKDIDQAKALIKRYYSWGKS